MWILCLNIRQYVDLQGGPGCFWGINGNEISAASFLIYFPYVIHLLDRESSNTAKQFYDIYTIKHTSQWHISQLHIFCIHHHHISDRWHYQAKTLELFLTKIISIFPAKQIFFSMDGFQTIMSSSSWLWDFQISLQQKYEKILFCSGMRSSLDKVVHLNYSGSLGCLCSYLSRNLSKYKLIQKKMGKSTNLGIRFSFLQLGTQ